MNEIILINITGKDKPGLTARLTDILAGYKVTILDIGQSVIHDYLSLGILIKIPTAHQSSAVLKDLLFAAHKIGIAVQFTPIDEDRYEAWVSQKGKERRVITLLGRELTAVQIAKVAAAIADKLARYKNGETVGPQGNLMWSQAAALSGQDIDHLAAFIETL